MNSTPYENPQDVRPEGTRPAAEPRSAAYPPPPPPTRHKSPARAAWLSCLPGLGQAYTGYYQQGFVNILVVASTITVLSANMVNGLEPLLGFFLAFYWLFNIIDANRRAHHFNRVVDGLGAEDVPEDFELPQVRGSLFSGAVLIVVGVLFLLDLNFDVSLAWIKDWWPLLLVGFGVRMIFRSRNQSS